MFGALSKEKKEPDSLGLGLPVVLPLHLCTVSNISKLCIALTFYFSKVVKSDLPNLAININSSACSIIRGALNSMPPLKVRIFQKVSFIKLLLPKINKELPLKLTLNSVDVLKVSTNQNNLMKTSFLPQNQQNIVRISVRCTLGQES